MIRGLFKTPFKNLNIKMTLTRYGVAYNLNSSPYKCDIDYDNFKVQFMFSTSNNKDRFKEKLKENRKVINSSLSKRFKFTIQNNFVADLKLYNNVESRGFLIKCEENNFECLEEVKFDGRILTKKNLQEL